MKFLLLLLPPLISALVAYVVRPYRAAVGWFNALFPVVFAAVAWTGLYLRDWRLKTSFAR